MSFLKKLFLFATLALNIPFIAQAHDTLSYEKNCILNFAQELRLQNSPKTDTIAQWLDDKVMWENDSMIPTMASIK